MNSIQHKSSTRILVITPSAIPCISTHIGVLRPLAELEKKKLIQLRISHDLFYKVYNHYLIEWSDVVVFCRNNQPVNLEYLYLCKKRNKKVIYELDDNFFEISLATSVGRYYRNFSHLHVVKRFFQLSDLTRVYSKHVEEQAKLHQAQPVYGKLYFDHGLIKNEETTSASSPKIKIVYPTLRTDEPELKTMLYDALNVILTRYREQVELHLWGQSIPPSLQHLQNVVFHPAIHRYEKFIKAFYNMQFDIGLAPLIDTVFFQSKTNVKYREYAAAGIAGIYTNIPPYTNCIMHKQNGFFAENSTQGWVDAISALIESPELRQTIVTHSRSDVQQNYTLEQASDVFHQHIQAVLNSEENENASMNSFTKSVEVYHQTQHHLPSVIKPITYLLQGEFSSFNIDEDAFRFLQHNQKHSNGLKICVIDNETMLELICSLFHPQDSLVFDLTAYQGDRDVLLSCLSEYKPTVVIHDDCKLKSFLDDAHLSYSLVKHHQGFTDVYTMEGVHSIYLDIIDQYFYQGYRYAQPEWKIGVADQIQKLRRRFHLFLDQLRIIKFHLKWLLGFRKL